MRAWQSRVLIRDSKVPIIHFDPPIEVILVGNRT
jgi:hypothetical protein